MKFNQIKTHIILIISVFFITSVTFAKEFHVSAEKGKDSNSGTITSPFLTIQHAANLAMPGDTITVHSGTYREHIDPPRGGDSNLKRITYQTFEKDKVFLKGSEVVKNWIRVGKDIWKVTLPKSFFGDFNPFDDLLKGDWFKNKGRKTHSGAVYYNGNWLLEAKDLEDLKKETEVDALWFANVEKDSTTIWAQFKNENPNNSLTEVNVRQTVFYPSKEGINYITVNGFNMCHAATPWAPPTAEQIGLIGTHWSKGWIIENNTISYSMCSGISLGKYGDEYDNTSASSAGGYNKSIERALAYRIPWNKENVGSHIVRNNTISYCEQAGIVGSLGGAFSLITNNIVHDIHIKRFFSGAEMAGIKLHGAIDTEISHNHIYRTCRGVWLDWMSQGVRVSRNLFHDNTMSGNTKKMGEDILPGGEQDLFVEVNHGPFIVDNNFFLSDYNINNRSSGGAYIHNLFAGSLRIVTADKRLTPYLLPHSTAIAGLHDYHCGYDRFYNNIFLKDANLSNYDTCDSVWMDGNLFLGGAIPSKHEKNPVVLSTYYSFVKLTNIKGNIYLNFMAKDILKKKSTLSLINSKSFKETNLSRAAYENPYRLPIIFDKDYSGNNRVTNNIIPGPINIKKSNSKKYKVWSLSKR